MFLRIRLKFCILLPLWFLCFKKCDSGKVVVGVFRDFHVKNGKLQPGRFPNAASCRDMCRDTNWCHAVDFDLNSATCWFHGVDSLCNERHYMRAAIHYKFATCSGTPLPPTEKAAADSFFSNIKERFRNAHIVGGNLIRTIRNEAMCVRACVRECKSADFDNNDHTCWHHYGSGSCDSPNAFRRRTNHYKTRACGAPQLPANPQPPPHPIKPVLRPPVIPAPLPAPPPGPPQVLCGRSTVPPSGARIIGGDESRPHSWPWQVALRNINASSSRCAGTLVTPYWVLTTAHCVDQAPNPSMWFVLAGAHDLLRLEAGRRVHTVTRIVIHPHFDLNTFDNDIALLRLASPVRWGHNAKPICLPPPNFEFRETARCYITGWGVAENGRRPLKQAVVPLVPMPTCRQQDWLGAEFILTERMMCAGFEHGGVDSCQGDSGGPMVCYINNHWVQAGLTSFGRGCGLPRKPGVYTKVSQFIHWIGEITSTF